MNHSSKHLRRKIYYIVKLNSITRMWRWIAGGVEKNLPQDVPPGHIAVIAGKRFVIKAVYLNHPIFRQLLEQEYEEYGYKKNGLLTIPCNEFLFQDIIQMIRGHADMSQLPRSRKNSTPLL